MSEVERETSIHPTAVVVEGAKIGQGVCVGPYCIINKNVEIGDNCTLHNHVVLDGHLKVGENNNFYSFCSIGAPPQDTGYKKEPTRVVIGNDNTFREYVSIHRGTTKQDQVTKVGDNNFIMAQVHFGHDVTVGNGIVIANSVNLAGHVTIGDKVTIGGGCNVSQFCTVGRGAYIGGMSAINRDIPSFCTGFGNRIRLKGINIIGLRRSGYSRQIITEVVDFFRSMEDSAISQRSFVDHEELMKDYQGNEVVAEIAQFIRKSEVGIATFMRD